MPHPARQALKTAAHARRDEIIATAQALIAVPSPNPPLATRPIAASAAARLRHLVPDAHIALHDAGQDVVNLVASVTGNTPGRRLVLNGHLDTYPVNEALPWTVNPLGGTVRDGRLYGRGAADMKGGIAASITAFALLAHCRAAWRGELVLTLAGDEESMGTLGTQWLIENIPNARGDAAIIGDAGSPTVLRFGEKGFLWVEVTANGKPAHGAHVHLGVNAIDRLRAALDALTKLRELAFPAPEAVIAGIATARPVSEPLSGAGEAETLSRITVNIGQIAGGTSMNLIPAAARAGVDIRLPIGAPAAAIEAEMARITAGIEGVACRVLRRSQPNYTPPDAEIVRTVTAAATDILGTPPAANMRVGGSDARLFRAAGIPTVVYGPTPFNMGGADEYALIDELHAVAAVHAIAAYEFLSAG